jgi:hypothetical protein
MKILGQKLTVYLIGGNIAALLVGYTLRAPDLQATALRQATIRSSATETSLDRQEAMQRSQSCILVKADMPLTDGTAAYFSSIQGGKAVINKNRPMPNGVKVCDRFGNTGIVDSTDGTPIVSDIRSMPMEEMIETLQERGLLKPSLSKTKGKKS